MTWYNELEQHELPTENRSLVIATSNLLQRYDYDLDPTRVCNILTADDTNIDFWSLPRCFDEFQFSEFAEGESWPSSNIAIVRQRRVDEQAAGMVDHYSLVADQRAHSIIDSLDGKIKSASSYGAILSWASYTYEADERDEPIPEPIKDDTIHILSEDENLWDIGRQYNIPVANLIAENDIEDPRHIPAGTEIYLPERVPKKDTGPEITYELLSPARKMHVVRPNGAKKWSFGGAKRWEDLYSTGRLLPRNTNVTIVAVAHVPIQGITAAYYMDAISLGDYEDTGLVRYTNGYNWQHLAEGHTVTALQPTPEVIVEHVVADAMKEEDRPQHIEIETPDATPELIIKPAPTSWKDTFQFLNKEQTAIEYIFDEPLTVVEVENKLPSKKVGRNDAVRIIGTFERDGVLYGRPAVRGFWYGVPMDCITPEDSVYNTDIDLPTKVALRGELTTRELWLVRAAKAAQHYKNLVGLVKRNK